MLFMEMADAEAVTPDDVPLQALVPAFMISELKARLRDRLSPCSCRF